MTLMALNNNSIMNESTRKGGFAPVQWVLGRFPRCVGSIHDEEEFAKLGVLTDEVTPDVAFAKLINCGRHAVEHLQLRIVQYESKEH